MLKLVGIDHVVTAAYNPRCNGLVERFNQTFIESLRKYCETNPTEWPEWLPFTLMCYKARKHSTIGFSPDYLMFGRERNAFINYNDDNKNNERLVELKTLINGQQKALENIEIKQTAQSKIQNLQHNILEKPLDVGTKVNEMKAS